MKPRHRQPLRKGALFAQVSDEVATSRPSKPKSVPKARTAATSGSSGGHAPASTVPRASAPATPGQQAGAGAVKLTEGQLADTTGGKAGRGRKAITVEEYLDAQWKLWLEADEHSPFYNDRAEVTLRSIRRYIDKATVSFTQEKGPEKKEVNRFGMKQLQVMESVIKANIAWVSKKNRWKEVLKISTRLGQASWLSPVLHPKSSSRQRSRIFCG